MTDKKMEQSTVKRWHHKSRIVLIVLGVVAIIVYLFQAGLAKQYAGIGAALCVLSVGGFLVWHAMHVFLEEDVIEEREINKDHTGEETDPTTPPPGSGQKLK